MLSYVYPDYRSKKIVYWEYDDQGNKNRLEADMPLYFYIEDEDGDYKTVTGKNAKRLEFNTYKQLKEKRDELKSYGVKLYESDISLQTKFICNNYYGIELKLPKGFNVFKLDIETFLETGFPHPDKAEGEVTLISIYSTRNQKYTVFSCRDFDKSFVKIKTGVECEKRLYNDEVKLLRDFIRFIRYEHPDILTGWNSQDYDIPYLINRMKKLLDPEEYKLISPVDDVNEIEVRDKKSGIFKKQYFIQGINCIDLMEVYKNYTPSIKPSYSLNAICMEELGEGKLEYSGTLNELFKENWQQYVEYNISDVDLLRKLDNKLGYLNLLITFCYGCRVPFEHYSKTTRVLDGAFVSNLVEAKIVLPDVNRALIEEMKRLNEAKEEGTLSDDDLDTINSMKYVGGYVKDPEKGIHEWITSFDATSLYPSIMMGWNISPETKVGTIDENYIDLVYQFMASPINNLGENKIHVTIGSKRVETTISKVVSIITENGYCLAANGTFYRQNSLGIIPKFVNEWFNKRKEFKKKMIDAKKKGNKDQAQYYDLLQWTNKILINSVYGFLGTRYSRFYDVDNARAVTLTGQSIIKKSFNHLNNYFEHKWNISKLGKSLNVENFNNIVVYCDTDSIYVHGGRLLESSNINTNEIFTQEELEKLKTEYGADEITQENNNINIKIKDKVISHEIKHERVINCINRIFEPVIQKLIDDEMKKFTLTTCNCKENKISFKRESICRSAIFVEKKKYAMWVLNDEGNVPIDKLKVVGLDIVRANTPYVAKKALKEIVFNMLKKIDRDFTVNEIRKTREKFFASPIEDISFNSPINGLIKYTDKFDANNEQFKATPFHVRGAIIYNQIMKDKVELHSKYDFIYNGDKAKVIYLKTSPTQEYNVISYKGKWPTELGLTDNIDYEQQFSVSTLNLLNKLFNLLNWELPQFDCYSFDDLFK